MKSASRAGQVARVERVAEAVAVPLEHLGQIRLVERQLARLQRLDPSPASRP